MCEVVSIVAGVAAAGSLAMNFMGQQGAAGQAADQVAANNDYKRRMQNFRNDRYLRQADSIHADVADKTNAMMERVNQMKRAAMFEIEKSARGSRAASSTVTVARDEQSGNTIRALQNEAARVGAETQQVIWTNLEGQIMQANRQLRGIAAQGQSMLERAYPDPMAPFSQAPSGPNPLSLIFGMGSIAANATASGLNLSNPSDPADVPEGTPESPFTEAEQIPAGNFPQGGQSGAFGGGN